MKKKKCLINDHHRPLVFPLKSFIQFFCPFMQTWCEWYKTLLGQCQNEVKINFFVFSSHWILHESSTCQDEKNSILDLFGTRKVKTNLEFLLLLSLDLISWQQSGEGREADQLCFFPPSQITFVPLSLFLGQFPPLSCQALSPARPIFSYYVAHTQGKARNTKRRGKPRRTRPGFSRLTGDD